MNPFWKRSADVAGLIRAILQSWCADARDTHRRTVYPNVWVAGNEPIALNPLIGIQRAHLELYIRHLRESGLRVSSVNTMMHGVRGRFRYAHVDG